MKNFLKTFLISALLVNAHSWTMQRPQVDEVIVTKINQAKDLQALFALINFTVEGSPNRLAVEEAVRELLEKKSSPTTKPPRPAPRRISPAPRRVAREQITRENFFKDIVGMDERDFRRRYDWSLRTGKLEKKPTKDQLTRQFPRSKAIFEGTFEFLTVGQLNKKIGSIHAH